MPDYELVGKGDSRDLQSSISQVETKLTELNQIQSKAQEGAKRLAGGMGLTSKEMSAAARSAGLTSGELRKLLKEEKITTDEALKLAAAQRRVDESTEGLKESSASAAQSLGSMAKGAAAFVASQIVSEAAKAASTLYQMSAASERAEFVLNTLSKGQADEYIDAIRKASHNTISAFDGFTIANKALQFGIVGSAADMGHLSAVAAALGRVMGQDATKSFDDLTTASARMSKLVADNLGIMVDMNRVTSDAAMLMKQDARLTEEMARAKAFLNQIIEAGTTEQMQAILANQDALQTTEQINAEWEDLKASLGEDIKIAVLPALREVAKFLHDVNQRRDTRWALEMAKDWVDYMRILSEAGLVSEETYRIVKEGGQGSIQAGGEIQRHALLWDEYTEESKRAQEQIERTGGSQRRAADITRSAADAAQLLAMRELELTDVLLQLEQGNNDLNPAVLDVVSALEIGTITSQEAAHQLAELGATSQDVAAAQNQLTEAHRTAEEAARAYEQALKDQQREHEALASIVAKTSADIAQTGARAWAESSASGEAYLEFLRAAGVDLSLFPGKYDEIRLATGLVTEEQLRVEQGFRLLSDAMTSLDPTIGLQLFEEWRTGAIGDIDELQARIDAIRFEGMDPTEIAEMMRSSTNTIGTEATSAAGKVNAAATETELAIDKMRRAAEDDLGMVNTAISTISETLEDVADAVDRSFTRMVADANTTASAVGKITSSTSTIVQALAAIPSAAAAAFGGLATSADTAKGAMFAVAGMSGTVVDSVGAIASGAQAASSAFGSMSNNVAASKANIAEVTSIVRALKEYWQWLQGHYKLDLQATITEDYQRTGGGGPIFTSDPGLMGGAPASSVSAPASSHSIVNHGPIYVYPVTMPLTLDQILVDVSANLSPAPGYGGG